MNLKTRLDQGLKNISGVFREKNVMQGGDDLRRHPDLAVHAQQCLTVRLLSAPDMDVADSTQMADIGFMEALRPYRTHVTIDQVHAIFNKEAEAMRAERAAPVEPHAAPADSRADSIEISVVGARKQRAYARVG